MTNTQQAVKLRLTKSDDFKEIQKILAGFKDIHLNMDDFHNFINTDVVRGTAIQTWMALVASSDSDPTMEAAETAFLKLFVKYADISFQRKALILKALLFNTQNTIKHTDYEAKFIEDVHKVLGKTLFRLYGCMYASAARTASFYMNKILRQTRIGQITDEDQEYNAIVFSAIAELFYALNKGIDGINEIKKNYIS